MSCHAQFDALGRDAARLGFSPGHRSEARYDSPCRPYARIMSDDRFDAWVTWYYGRWPMYLALVLLLSALAVLSGHWLAQLAILALLGLAVLPDFRR